MINQTESHDSAPSVAQPESEVVWRTKSRVSRSTRLASGIRYKNSLLRCIRNIIPKCSRVLHVGSGDGSLLRGLDPDKGVGIEAAPDLAENASANYPKYAFNASEFEAFDTTGDFDFILVADVLLDVYDIDAMMRNVRTACSPDTRVVVTNYSQVWRPILKLLRLLRIARPRFGNTWFSPGDVRSAFERTGFQILSERSEVLFPSRLPILSSFCNRFLSQLPIFNWFCLHRIYVARLEPEPITPKPSVTVLVPARNESGNVPRLMSEIPDMGSFTEVIFVEGNSTDDTWEVLQEAIAERDDPLYRLIKQPGKGKGDAVRAGFSEARGDILMILDADLTVAPDMLPRFYDAVSSGRAEFANGTRLVYQMHDRAMRFLNLLGNHFFAKAFTYVMGQPIRDTLCGTKVLTRDSYNKIVANRDFFGEFDPFGDFDLLFGAARLNMKILDVPVRYGERVYGETNISRFRHGTLLFRMLFVGARKLKFR